MKMNIKKKNQGIPRNKQGEGRRTERLEHCLKKLGKYKHINGFNSSDTSVLPATRRGIPFCFFGVYIFSHISSWHFIQSMINTQAITMDDSFV